MSWYRQVKTLFTASLVLFLYIIWAIIGNFFFDNVIDFRIFLLAAAVVFLMQYLSVKGSNKYTTLVVPGAITALVTYFIKGKGFWLDTTALIVILLLFYRIEDEDINYFVYRARIRQMVYIMIALGIVLPMINMELSKSILRFYIIFLMSTVLVQREARAYSYKLKTRKRMAANLGIIFVMLALSWERVFLGVIAFIKIAYIPINYVLEKIIYVVAFLIIRPLEGVIQYLSTLVEAMMKKKAGEGNEELITKAKDLKFTNTQGIKFPAWVNSMFKVLIAIVIVYTLFKLFEKYRIKSDKVQAAPQQREKIEREKLKERKISSVIKDLFRSTDNRSRVLNVFRKFEKTTFEKEIFKEHMTATQLTNVTKAYVNIKAEKETSPCHHLEEIRSIYNEAKFSNHDIEDEKAKSIKENYEKIKRSIKKD